MFGMVKAILQNWAGKPATRLYPFDKRDAFENARGQLEIDIDNCIFCGICVRKCPSTCLTVEKANSKWELDPYNCVVCGVCVEACPQKMPPYEQELPYSGLCKGKRFSDW